MLSMFHRSLAALLAVLLIGSLASCSDNTVAPPDKKPLISGPTAINFGDVPVGSCRDTVIRYDNITGKEVTLSSADFSGVGFEWTGAELPVKVAAGASIDVRLRFCPSSLDTAKVTLNFTGTGGEGVKITLTGFSTQSEPNAGSTYTFATYDTDQSGAKVAGSDATELDIITATHTSYQGKNNVFIVSEDGVQNYYNKEANGDISVFVDAAQGGQFGGLIGGWKQLPYGSKLQNVELLRKDTNITVSGIPVPITASITQIASYAGKTSQTIGGKTYDVENATFTTTINLSALGASVGNVTIVVKGGYIAAIGYQGTYSEQVNSTIAQIPSGGFVKTLTSFEIK